MLDPKMAQHGSPLMHGGGLEQLLQNPIALMALQRLMAAKNGLPGLPGPAAMPDMGSAAALQAGGGMAAMPPGASAIMGADTAGLPGMEAGPMPGTMPPAGPPPGPPPGPPGGGMEAAASRRVKARGAPLSRRPPGGPPKRRPPPPSPGR